MSVLQELRVTLRALRKTPAFTPGGDRVERIELLGTTPNYFELLGARAALGRVYAHADRQPALLDADADGISIRNRSATRSTL